MIRIPACKVGDVEEGTVRQVTLNDRPPIAIYKIEGQFYATDDTCTHGEASLADGYVEGELIICPYHAGSFEIKTGEPVEPPCFIAIKTYRTSVEGQTVFIAVPGLLPE